jgi:hypothetical protein
LPDKSTPAKGTVAPAGDHGLVPNPAATPAATFGRMVAFLILAIPAVAMLGALVLLPAWISHQNTLYDGEMLKAEIADTQLRIAGNEAGIKAADNDHIYQKRLAISLLGLLPPDEVIVDNPNLPPSTPGVVKLTPHPRPSRPDDWFYQMGVRLQNRRTQLGLAALSFAALAAGIFIFPTPRKYIPKPAA